MLLFGILVCGRNGKELVCCWATSLLSSVGGLTKVLQTNGSPASIPQGQPMDTVPCGHSRLGSSVFGSFFSVEVAPTKPLHGHLIMSGPVSSCAVDRWRRPSEIMQEQPRMIANVNPYNIKQVGKRFGVCNHCQATIVKRPLPSVGRGGTPCCSSSRFCFFAFLCAWLC